jgi:hypothetical protein
MTKDQKTDFQNWKQNQNQLLPESLKNVLVEDCLKELKNWNVLEKYDVLKLFPTQDFYFFPGDCCLFNSNFTFISKEQRDTKILFIQTILSCTPNDQVIIQFLDVKNDPETMKSVLIDLNIPIYLFTDTVLSNLRITLFFAFAFLLSDGKTFDEALKIINLIYLQNIYV